MSKHELFLQVEQKLKDLNFKIVSSDQTRPWGGFFVIDEAQAQIFADTYFDGLDVQSLKISGKLSPKILIVAPGKRLSWQYHHRRAEVWRVVSGQVEVVRSFDDTERETVQLAKNETIRLAQGERHRLIGLEVYGVVAEIWQHTDPQWPSDEEDIVRVQDDFGR